MTFCFPVEIFKQNQDTEKQIYCSENKNLIFFLIKKKYLLKWGKNELVCLSNELYFSDPDSRFISLY